MSSLSKYEKETIILWNQSNESISIQTYDSKFKRRLADFAKRFPDLCKLERSNDLGGVFYLLEKSRFSYRLIAPYSEDRKKQISEQAKKSSLSNSSV
ncbi:MAG: molecular chaperone [Eubacteriales bacterium]|nr:molecular chaperone [Eubacteriales bacterium]